MPRAWYFGERAQNAAKRFGAFLGILFILWAFTRISWVANGVHAAQGGLYGAAHAIARIATLLFAS